MALIDKLSAIGNAIREKNGTSDLIPLADMPQAILDIVSGGSGVSYTSITYNNDDTITLIGTDGTEHKMVCTYEGENLASVTYDGTEISIGYEGEDLKSVGNTVVDLSYAFKGDEGETLLANAQFTSNFQYNSYKNEIDNDDYQLTFSSKTLTEPTYCENGLDHTVGGFAFNYSTQWENEFLNYNENTIIAMVKIMGKTDGYYDRQRLFDFYPTTSSSSHIGFGDGKLYKARNVSTSTTPSALIPIEYDKWYVVTLVYRNGKYYTYLDDGIVNPSFITDKENQDSLIGAHFLRKDDWAYLNGYVRNLTYFNRALTSSEVVAVAKTLLESNKVGDTNE